MLRSAHRTKEYPDFLQSHVRSRYAAAVHRKADLAVYDDVHTTQVSLTDRQSPRVFHLNMLLPQYSLYIDICDQIVHLKYVTKMSSAVSDQCLFRHIFHFLSLDGYVTIIR